MKKITFCLVLFLGFSLLGLGQENTTQTNKKKTHHQIGANIGGLVKGLLGKENNSNLILGANDVFTFKTGKNNVSFRAGLGFNFEKQNDANGGEGTKQSSYSVRIGFEKLTKITNRWQYYAGVDLKYAKTNFESDNDFFLGPNKFHSYAIAPLLGVQFRLTEKLVLQTEASLNFIYSKSESLNFFDPFPIFPPQPTNFFETGETKGIFLVVPNTLYLVFDL